MQPHDPIPLDDASLAAHLVARGLVAGGDTITVEPAGDGNINWVRRARSRSRSWIVKQARPALERFPQYRASTERIVFEERWFAIARPLDARGVCPRVLDFDAERRALVLEDLGDAERLDHALLRGGDVRGVLCDVGALLGAVHRATREAALAERFANDDMRRLHGEHVFVLPFAPNDFPLEPELRARAERVWQDRTLGTIAAEAHRRYLEPRGALLHGDVQAGNVLIAPGGRAKLLDAEIAHVGDPAFDVGVLLAHPLLAAIPRHEVARAATAAADTWEAYAAAHGAGAPPFAAVARYAGIEVLRRSIGAARVAAVAATPPALAAVDLACALIRTPPTSPEALVRYLGAPAR